MYKVICAGLALAFVSLTAANADDGKGLIVKKSIYSFEDTISKLEEALAARNIGVMNKIDHAANAESVDMTLRPTTLVIFGNPAVGSQLMAASQSIGIDLPLKALVIESETGEVYVIYNDIRALAERHGVPSDHEAVNRIAGGLEMVSNAASGAAE